MACDALGRPLRFILTGGQVSDCTQANGLLVETLASHVIADKGYDTDAILAIVSQRGAQAVIPPKANRKLLRDYDRVLYRQRNRIERTFNRLKHYRRIATRYDRKAVYFASFLYLAATLLWI
jgi:transposase